MSWPPRDNSIDVTASASHWEIRRDDDQNWQTVTVPSAWQHILGNDFHGVAWYRTALRLPRGFHEARAAGRRFWLRFQSVATDAAAWVNGIEIGRHIGDYAPFQFDVTRTIGDARTIDLLLRIDELHAPKPANEGDLQQGHITKGFHDVISLQHGGLWQPVHLAHTGNNVAIPDGIAVRADPATESVTIEVQAEADSPDNRSITVHAEISDPDGAPITASTGSAPLTLRVHSPRLWSPDEPALYRARVELHDTRGVSETHEVRFGFRTVRTKGRTILLNDQPLMIRGVLDWGHEPAHIAPAPHPDEVRERFVRFREMGFNTVCLCMWYPPRWFFDIADDTGMIIWQEHPVWQSPMRDNNLAEYKRLYSAFLRRDRNHPSVCIVSATCEHPSFHPDLATWWWDRARHELPGTLLELQTAFFKWADLTKTDLYDEHTYDNSNRWVGYIDDVAAHLDTLPPKPFVMGETILFTSWPDLRQLQDRLGDERPWWLPRAFEHMIELEQAWRDRYGDTVVERFREQGDRFHILGRKFQVEQFRRQEGNAGLVMNHLRDVPQCQCGFIDDLDQHRFDPEQTRGWLGDQALLLWTPDHRRCFGRGDLHHGGTEGTEGIHLDLDSGTLPCSIALSNFRDGDFDGSVVVRVCGPNGRLSEHSVRLACDRGSVQAASIELPLSIGDEPRKHIVEALIPDGPGNRWDLWTFPTPGFNSAPGVYRFAGLPFEAQDSEPDDVERGYSRGYGLPVRNWQCALPDPGRLAPNIPGFSGDNIPDTAQLILTHRLTDRLLDYLTRGGRLILFASKAPGGLGTSYEWLFGQIPLIIEEGPLQSGDSEWIVDALGYDLTRRYARVIPIETIGLAAHVDPLIRLVYTHDQSRVKLFDMLFHARVGDGSLIVSSLDHSEAPGQYLLDRMIRYVIGECTAGLHPAGNRPLSPGASRASRQGETLPYCGSKRIATAREPDDTHIEPTQSASLRSRLVHPACLDPALLSPLTYESLAR